MLATQSHVLEECAAPPTAYTPGRALVDMDAVNGSVAACREESSDGREKEEPQHVHVVLCRLAICQATQALIGNRLHGAPRKGAGMRAHGVARIQAWHIQHCAIH